MAVAITWSTTQGGAAVAEALTGGGTGVDHGTSTNGTTLAERIIWLRHDGVNQITNCGFYLAEYSGAYGGDASAAADLAEVLAWGDGLAAGGPAEANEFGGIQLNFNGGDASPSDWPTFGTQQPTNGATFQTGTGDSVANKITLPTTMGTAVTAPGVIAAGNNDARFHMRVQLPTDEDTAGVRQVDQVLRYTFTS